MNSVTSICKSEDRFISGTLQHVHPSTTLQATGCWTDSWTDAASPKHTHESPLQGAHLAGVTPKSHQSWAGLVSMADPACSGLFS